jgi:predicted transcriptional regulator
MKSIFVETLGNSPQVKVLDCLIGGHMFSWTLMDIKNSTEVSYATLKYLLPKMLKNKLVVIEKKVGKAKLYKLNLENKAIKHLMAFDWNLARERETPHPLGVG